MKKLWNWILSSSIRIFFSLAIIATLLIIVLDSLDGEFNFHDILVEAHGLVYDLIVFGVIIALYDTWRDKKEKARIEKAEQDQLIQRYQEELDDYRNWDALEAMHRVDGILRRLEKLVDWRTIDIKDLHLGGCELKYVVKAFEEEIPFCSLQGFKFDKQYLEENNLNIDFLKSAFLSMVNLESAKLSGANLESARLSGANLESARLSGANLESATLWYAHLESTDLREANLESANLMYAHLESASLSEAHLESANLFGAHLESAYLREAHLESADLSGAHLESADLYGANLESANLSGAHLESVKLPGAHLESAKLLFANLRSADLRVANLESADLMYANLESADLRVANLQSANLFGAHLQSADLREATVDQKYWIENLATIQVKGAKEIAQKYIVDLSSEVKFCDVETKEERSYFTIKEREKTKQFSSFEGRLNPSQKRGKVRRLKK